MLNHIVTGLVILFLILGGLDCAFFNNRWGFGEGFRRGLDAAGSLLLCMTGFIVLAPLLAELLSPVVSPLFKAVGADPSAFAGLFFANDSGGAALAMQLAEDPDMGRFNGLITGSMLGTAIVYIIPLSILYTRPEHRDSVVYGLLAGIITIPVGCLAGGAAAGFSMKAVFLNTLPALVIAVILALMLLFCRSFIVKALSIFGKAILGLSILGLVVSASQRLSGIELIHGLGDLDEVFSIVGGICLFLAGIFPFISFVQKLLAKPFRRLSNRLGVNETSVSGFFLALANGIPVCHSLPDMNDRGRMLNTAFLVSVSCVFGDHLAYTTQVDPSMNNALIIGKLAGGFAGLLLAMLLAPRLLPAKKTDTP